MPIYEYRCPECGETFERLRPVHKRRMGPLCNTCKVPSVRRVESFRAITFEPYFDEGLGCDVTSASEKRRILREENLIEAGDPVHGGRNFDEKAPHHIGKFEPQGKPYAPKLPPRDFSVATADRNGNTLDVKQFSELPEG